MPVLRRVGEDFSAPARIVALGCGGAGCTILRRMRPSANLVPVAVGDALHPAMAGITSRVLVEGESLRALAEADPAVAKDAAAPADKAIAAAIEGSHIGVVFAGLGSDTGGWVGAIASRVARGRGMTTIAIVATPFASEGRVRGTLATDQAAAISKSADAVVAFAHDGLLRMAPTLPLARAFGALGAMIVRPAEELARVARVGDVESLGEVWRSAATWRFGGGEGRDRHAAFLAAEEAMDSPWFVRPPEDARAAMALLAVAPSGPTDEVVQEVGKRLPRANLLVGVAEDPALVGRVRLSLLVGWP